MAAFTVNDIRAMTVLRLRSELSQLCLDTSGRKSALVDRLIQAQILHADSDESTPSAASGAGSREREPLAPSAPQTLVITPDTIRSTIVSVVSETLPTLLAAMVPDSLPHS
eukprot:scpid103174/ scgid35356/ 